MSERGRPGPYDSIARKWLDLAERRKAHLIELYDSGRWKHYYSEAAMVAEVRACILACDDWAKIVGAPPQADVSASERGTREAGHVEFGLPTAIRPMAVLPKVSLSAVDLPDQRYRV